MAAMNISDEPDWPKVFTVLFFLLLAIALMSTLCGCSYTYPIGTIGSKQLIKVQAGSLSGPTQTMIAMIDTNTHEVTFLSPMGGNGILSSVTVAGSIVAGSYFIGKGLEKGGDHTTVNAVANSTAQSFSEAVANPVQNVIVPDPSPAPMIRRPPYRWGHDK